MSVDNYAKKYSKYFFQFKWKDLKVSEKIKNIRRLIIGKKIGKKEIIDLKSKDINHLVQSKYAEEFLKNKGVNLKNILYLSDYINNDFFIKNTNEFKREDVILYNPKKGEKITKKIMKKFSQYRYIPLENMTVEQLRETYLKSKIYIDFGNHPGKDRIPREAAALGCVVLTNKKGSAKYFEDVSIPEKYKYSDNEINRLGEDIKFIFENFENVSIEYEYYRNKIKDEEKVFDNEILKFLNINSLEGKNEKI